MSLDMRASNISSPKLKKVVHQWTESFETLKRIKFWKGGRKGKTVLKVKPIKITGIERKAPTPIPEDF